MTLPRFENTRSMLTVAIIGPKWEEGGTIVNWYMMHVCFCPSICFFVFFLVLVCLFVCLFVFLFVCWKWSRDCFLNFLSKIFFLSLIFRFLNKNGFSFVCLFVCLFVFYLEYITKLHSHTHCDMQSRYLLKDFNPGQSARARVKAKIWTSHIWFLIFL